MMESMAVNPVIPGRPDSRKLGMWLFIVSEVMFFTALIAASMNMKLRAPANANHVLNVPVTAINTFVLIVSSTAVVMALSALQDNRTRVALRWMWLTVLLGLTFIGIQLNEYRILIVEKNFTPTTNLFGAAFYPVTSFHGFHVLMGVLTLLWMIWRVRRGTVSPANSVPFESWGLYWHLVDVVWIILFTILYLL